MLQKLKSLSRWQKAAAAVLVLAVTAVPATLISRNLWQNRPFPDAPDTPDIQITTPIDSSMQLTDAFAGVESFGGGEFLQISLSEGQAEEERFVANPVVAGDPLTAAEIEAILDRLPPFTAVSSDIEPFRLPDELIPPPQTGETIAETFPPPPSELTPPLVDDGPLTVLRYSPEGEIPLAPFLNVTFSQPMVPLTSLESLSEADIPVNLTPSIPGTWRWVSPETVSFTYDSDVVDRFPKATDFVAEIPAGTQSATGGVLAEAVTWTFSTPPPVVESFYPQNSSQPLEPIMFVSFDQLIDPDTVLATIQVREGGQTVSLRQATAAEIEADETVSRLVESSAEGRWLAFRAERPFNQDTSISIGIGPGTPSAEGPRITESAQTFDFRTYPPLEIIEYRCGWSDDCSPLTPFFINFSNPIDFTTVDETIFLIDPPLPGAVVDIQGYSITISGNTAGQTTYRVQVNGRIQDIFGQPLGDDQILSFRVGKANPFMSGADQPMISLDPSADAPFYTVYSININRLKVRAYAVEPTDWDAFGIYWREFNSDTNPVLPPGQEVMNKTISVDGEDDVLTETTIDLSEALTGDFGHLIVIVEPVSIRLDEYERQRFTLKNWVQVTNIGVDAFVDNEEMVVWATDLATGAPLSDVTIRLEPTGNAVTTAADGTVRFGLPNGVSTILTAQLGEDTAVLPSSSSLWGNYSWQAYTQTDQLRWTVFDDRGIYRPGEEVHLKGWIRQFQNRPDGDIGLADGITAVSYSLIGSQGNEILVGTADVNLLGGFDLTLTLPDNTNLGYATLQLQASGVSNDIDNWYYHALQIQEFRRPEFEVSAQNESSDPYFAGGEATVAVSANYFAGGALPNAELSWFVTSTPSSYSPPNWRDFTFGKWIPWWYGYDYFYEEEYGFGYGVEGESYETFDGVTDASGTHYLNLDFEETEGVQPFTVTAEATVMDVNRQAWTASTSLLVHPADLYVGLRSERTFVRKGTPLDIELIVTDLDGNPVAGQEIEVQAARLEWRNSGGGWNEEAVETQNCTIPSAAEPVTCSFTTDEGGTYRITATVTDAQGRANQSEFTRWVSGGKRPSARDIEQETVTLIPDRETYQPGDVAEILLQSPFSPAEGLLTVSRSGILYTERFQIVDGTATLQIPIEDGYIPNLNVQVDLVGETARTNADGEAIADVPSRPAFATGSLNLSIPPHSRTLTVTATPQDVALEPGGETTLDVQVVDANGQPVVGAEVAVVVVDEAILALSNYQLVDPLAIFYGERPSNVDGYYGRSNILLANPAFLIGQVEGDAKDSIREGQATNVAQLVTEEETAGEAVLDFASVAEFDDSSSPQAPPIQIRTNFDPLATFAPAVSTDNQGRAQVVVQLPDNLTRYRIMVVAVAGGKQFGTVEANLTARLPLMVRPSAPRFLNFGDQFELTALLQNQTDVPMEVDVVAEVTNIELTGGAGLRVTIPANDRVEVRFPATTMSAGTARVRITAVSTGSTSNQYADATSLEFPVYTPATTEAFAIYGTLDEGAVAQPVAFPDDVYTQFGGLEINTSSTALQSLTDAVLYINSYRYDSSEQLASRILAIASLRDVLSAFEAEGLPTPEEMETAVQRDIETLQGLQNDDGGFPIWQRGRESTPYFSIYVTHALVQAQAKGFDVLPEMLSNALIHLQEIENYYPYYYSEQTRQTLSAYALYVRHLAGDTDTIKAQNLFDEANLDDLSLEAAAWLWPLLQNAPAGAEIERHINNRAVETAGAANFTTSYGDEAYLMLRSNRRTDGIILQALITLQPDSDLIPKVVNGLLAHRTQGRWGNSQENTFILLALDQYFNTFEAETPDFVARIWLGETYAGEHTFVGRRTERYETAVPMQTLAELLPENDLTQNLILSKEGIGRLYYRLGFNYAPVDLNLEPLDMGFTVLRSYEAVDDPDDVFQDEDGVWHIKAGARVRVMLTMVTNNRRYHVALVDPLPAGLEIVNPELAVSTVGAADIADEENGRYYWWGPWYEYQNMRDERAEAFTTLLWEGVYEYSYIARATTLGTFIVPPAKAEEMYAPEVFGRSGTDWVIIEEGQ